ncbi:MAG: hypothetical protein ACYSUD_22510 [Planctomycetota bacterium]|jgi:hypothetical protein
MSEKNIKSNRLNLSQRLSGPYRLEWAVCFILSAFTVCGSAESAGLSLKVEQITFGPKHHFFGYIGQSKTIPWNAGGRYILALRVGYHDHMPGPGDAADVVLIDTEQAYKVMRVDQTRAWNFQQGTMFYWNPTSPRTQFFFNDRDPATNRIYTVLFDISKNKRVREFRYPDTPVGNSGVAQDGSAFLAINYARVSLPGHAGRQFRRSSGRQRISGYQLRTHGPASPGHRLSRRLRLDDRPKGPRQRRHLHNRSAIWRKTPARIFPEIGRAGASHRAGCR